MSGIFLILLLLNAGSDLGGTTRHYAIAEAPDPYYSDPKEQGLWEDAKEEQPKTQKADAPPENAAPPPSTRHINFLANVVLDYFFYHSREQLTLFYTIEFRQEVPVPVELENNFVRSFNGNASTNTEVTGHMAKWSGGECNLHVKIPRIPYRIQYTQKVGAIDALITMQKLGPVTEDWEARCSFGEDPDGGFNSSGPPEKWVSKMLDKIKTALVNKNIPLSDSFETEITFEIPGESFEDEDIGGVEIRAKGKLTLEPFKQERSNK